VSGFNVAGASAGAATIGSHPGSGALLGVWGDAGLLVPLDFDVPYNILKRFISKRERECNN
jgi:hypothetical protein